MKKILDPAIKNQLVETTGVKNYFSNDILPILEVFYFHSHEFILHEKELSDYLFFLAEGEVKIHTSAGDGKILAYGYYTDFRVLGEISCLWGEAAAASVQAYTKSYCFGIHLPRYRELLFNDVLFLRYICSILRKQLVMFETKTSKSQLYLTEQRFASLVLQNSKDDILQYSLVACADLLAVSYRHILRVVKTFCQQGLLEKQEHRRYRIVDRKRLEALAVSSSSAKEALYLPFP